MAPDDARHPTPDQTATQRTGRISPLAKIVVVLSVLLMIAGGALKVVSMTQDRQSTGEKTSTAAGAADESDASTPTTGESSSLAPNSLLPSQTPSGGGDGSSDGDVPAGDPSATEATGHPLDIWSPALFQLGFSFFVGFSMGYAVRSFVKVSLIGIGLMLLFLFGLEYFGLITVDWVAVEGKYDGLMGWLQNEFGSFQNFVTGALPSAASGMGGLVLGFRRT